MPLDRLESLFAAKLSSLRRQGLSKGNEKVIFRIRLAEGGFGPRYFLQGYGERPFLRMNSNSYLGLSRHSEVILAEAEAAEEYGAGPGAVRFISGTYLPHVELEKRLARFHGRESAMIFSSAYTTMTGVLPQLISEDTLVVSDALNHSCIINAIRLANPVKKAVYPHAGINALDMLLAANRNQYRRACVVTDGIFSMRGDYAPLDEIVACCKSHEGGYAEGVITIVDDSHGVGAFGGSGRGTEEVTGASADVLIATLGKSLGVNGGYVVASSTVIDYLRETSPFYIYSNPITPAEAAASLAALNILDSQEGLELLEKVKYTSNYLRTGLRRLGYETLPGGEHPIVPLFIRDTEKTAELVAHLFEGNILATGLNYPVVPKGEQEIRLQVSAEHTQKDMDYLLGKLAEFKR